VGLILAKASDMWISIPLDLSSRPFIPLPRFMRSRRAATLLVPSLCCSYQLYRLFQTPHSFSVTIFTLGFRLFFILLHTYSPITLSNFSIVNLVSIFRCSSSTANPVYERRVTSIVLVFSLSSHRHSYTSYL
jgi:hypothetical protein